MKELITLSKGVTKLFFLLCFYSLLSGCSLPSLDNRPASSALIKTEARTTRLGMAIAPRVDQHPGKSGIYPLPNPYDAFAARMLLAKAADRTLDVQYYIWHKDITGTLLLEALHAAAKRGVRVRLLLDDNGISEMDEDLKSLDNHPNIEVRLFNPFMVRKPKWLGYITDFSRANRRMHNKSFTADNQTTIIGGRNVGDEYFGASNGVLFADLDILCVGPVVDDVSSGFDIYWASESSYPVGLILPHVRQERMEQLTMAADVIECDPAASNFINAVKHSAFINELLGGSLNMEWAPARMVSDDPAKGLGKAEAKGLLSHQLEEILGVSNHDVALVSPYFVPTATGVEAFSKMARCGVKVRILTNSLDATDVAAVHAGYAKWRKALLESGITLYEMSSQSSGTAGRKSSSFVGSSGSSLHAKTFAMDGESIFVGSFNFDPRSINLNTELGFVIDSPALARQIGIAFDSVIPTHAYQVLLGGDDKLYWIEKQGEKQIRYDHDPRTTCWKRGVVFLLSLLPIEWLL
ncbi:MAG: phospholipase D family protein [Smithellaceae bacterium]|nr:phospholipase D family protein [Smithellaceae bacterium]